MNKTQITTQFYPSGDRYMFDGLYGNYQIDSSQDAWYFGMWINPKEKSISIYAEGDFTKKKFLDTESLLLELLKISEFHKDSETPVTVDVSFWKENMLYNSYWEAIFNHDLFKKYFYLDNKSAVIRQL